MDRSKIKLCLLGAVITGLTVMLIGYFIAPDSSLIVLGLIGAVLGVVGALTLVNQIDKLQERVETKLNAISKLDQPYDPETREFFLTDLDEAFVRRHAQQIANTAKIDRTIDPKRIAVTHDGHLLGFVDAKFNDAMIPVIDEFGSDMTIRARVHTEEKLRLGISIRSKKTAPREALKKAFDACAEL